MPFIVTPGQTAYYRVCSGGQCSATFSVVPLQSRAETYAIFGDMGLTNDESMADLAAGAAAGKFDAVLLVLSHHTLVFSDLRYRSIGMVLTCFVSSVQFLCSDVGDFNRRKRLHEPRAGVLFQKTYYASSRQSRGTD